MNTKHCVDQELIVTETLNYHNQKIVQKAKSHVWMTGM